VETFGQPQGVAGEVIHTQSGDTVYSIAQRYKVPMRDIIALNNLRAPFQLPAGTPITLPLKDGAFAPVIIAPTKVDEPLDSGGAKTYEQIVPPHREKEADVPPVIHPQALTKSGVEEKVIYAQVQQDKMNEMLAEKQREKPVVQPSPITEALDLKPMQFDAKKKDLQPPKFDKKKKEAVAMVKPALPEKAGASKAHFVWPVKGKILSAFGSKDNGLRNDGVNIAAQRGEPVFAAQSGIVAYAGNDIPGYGNVVLIRHNDGWMTTYAHLERIYTQRDVGVAKGDMIGTVGMSGGLTVPQLHFEIRQGSEALNPERYLR
jgi:murein DD-endopeptidase MepM/ murein hydrolase activator NlpD